MTHEDKTEVATSFFDNPPEGFSVTLDAQDVAAITTLVSEVLDQATVYVMQIQGHPFAAVMTKISDAVFEAMGDNAPPRPDPVESYRQAMLSMGLDIPKEKVQALFDLGAPEKNSIQDQGRFAEAVKDALGDALPPEVLDIMARQSFLEATTYNDAMEHGATVEEAKAKVAELAATHQEALRAKHREIMEQQQGDPDMEGVNQLTFQVLVDEEIDHDLVAQAANEAIGAEVNRQRAAQGLPPLGGRPPRNMMN